MANCKHCGRPLNESQFRDNNRYKSCPKCSQDQGEYHVFYPCPDNFGVSDKRVTDSCPQGYQSYCTACRGGDTPVNGILCKDL